MIVAAVVRKENQILLQRAADTNNHWELPNCEILEVDNLAEAIVDRCEELNVAIEISDLFFEGMLEEQRIVVFNTDLITWVNTSSNLCSWIDTKEFSKLTFTKQHIGAIEKLTYEYTIINSINSEVERAVVEISEEFGITIECMTTYESFKVFVHNDYGNYCPFIFSIDHTLDSEENIVFMETWPITRMFAEGDKTDLYVLFAELMAIVLKCIFQKNVYVDCLSLFTPFEINAATVVFNNAHKNINIKDLKVIVEQNYSVYIYCLMLFEYLVGSFSLIRDDTKFISRYTEYLGDDDSYNSFSREEHQYYSNFKKGISFLSISNGIFNVSNLVRAHKWEFVDGIDGKIIHQIDIEEESFNYVSNDDWKRIQQVIRDMDIRDYNIVCQINHLYLLEQNGIWIFEGDFSEYWVNIEKEKILTRQSFESKVLHFNRLFTWRYPVNPGRFEELIADLLETEIMIQGVRLVGKSNNADGGRDLLIYKRYMQNTGAYGTILILGQCKAYEKSVSKSHVRDIRDTIENYNANGFFLATTSVITAQLVDHLCKMKEKIDVDWWTEREIFKKLRQHSNIADRYLDIIQIEN